METDVTTDLNSDYETNRKKYPLPKDNYSITNAANDTDSTIDNSIRCQFCRMKFDTRTELKIHENIHVKFSSATKTPINGRMSRKQNGKRTPPKLYSNNWSDVEKNVLLNAVTTVGKPILDKKSQEWEKKNAWRAVYKAVNASGFFRTSHQIKIAWGKMRESALHAFENHWKNNLKISDLDRSVISVLASDDDDEDADSGNRNFSSSGEETEIYISESSTNGRSKSVISTKKIIEKLDKIANNHSETDNEFVVFGKHVAEQLNKMPLQRAVICQEKIQSILTQERLTLLTFKGHKRSLTSSPVSDSSDRTCASPLADNENSSGE